MAPAFSSLPDTAGGVGDFSPKMENQRSTRLDARCAYRSIPRVLNSYFSMDISRLRLVSADQDSDGHQLQRDSVVKLRPPTNRKLNALPSRRLDSMVNSTPPLLILSDLPDPTYATVLFPPSTL